MGDVVVADGEMGRVKALFTDAVGAASLTRRIAELVSAFFVLHRQLAAAHLSDEMLPLHLRTLMREADGVIVASPGYPGGS